MNSINQLYGINNIHKLWIGYQWNKQLKRKSCEIITVVKPFNTWDCKSWNNYLKCKKKSLLWNGGKCFVVTCLYDVLQCLLVYFNKFWGCLNLDLSLTTRDVTTPTTYPPKPKRECCCAQNNGNKSTCSSRVKPQCPDAQQEGRKTPRDPPRSSTPFSLCGHRL